MSTTRRLGKVVFRKKKRGRFFVALFAGIVFYVAVLANIDRILSFFNPDKINTDTATAIIDPSRPSPLISSAFKLGHGLTQLRFAKTNDHEYIKWKNRIIVHLVALGIDISVLHETIGDGELNLDEMIVLRDQIKDKIGTLHGEHAASTFMVGVELVPVTQAFESYLKDGEYRNRLTKSNVSILKYGSLLNANLVKAVLPDNLKINLVTEHFETASKEAAEEKLDQIKRFREGIVNHFYKDKGDISNSEMIALSSAWISNSVQDKDSLMDLMKDPDYFLKGEFHPVDFFNDALLNDDPAK